LGECVAHALEGGESIVVDAANLRRGERERFLALAARWNARVTIVHCLAPLDVLRQRVGARTASGKDASEATVTLLERQPSYWEDFSAAERAVLLETDTTDAEAIARSLQRLATTHHDRA
jgi:predicted kinase